MTISLKVWVNPQDSNDTRIYIQGTTRKNIYFKAAADGRLVWSSKENTTAPRYRTGNHYEKLRKDEAACRDAAEVFGLTLGQKGEFKRALSIAQDGIEK